MSNPANRLPPEYDEMQPHDYDPQFTADISAQMRVPEKIAAFNGNTTHNDPMADVRHYDMQRTARMNVPDKIIMMGQEQSMGMRNLPNLHLDSTEFTDFTQMPVSLSTPPRVLTMGEIKFPETATDVRNRRVDDPEAMFVVADGKLLSQNGYIQQTPHKQNDDSLNRQALLATPGDHLLINDQEDDMMLLKKQINKLSYHVKELQEENAKRSQREVFMYPVVVCYLLYQVAKWFLTSK